MAPSSQNLFPLAFVAIATLGSGVGVALAQDHPKGMSKKEPGGPGPSDEETSKLLGAPDPEETIPDPGENYPEPEGVEKSKGSLPPPKIPSSPQLLRYKVTRPTRYVVRGTNRMAIKDREDLKQIYRTSNVVTYAPMSRDAPIPEPRWLDEERAQIEEIPFQPGEARVMMTVEKAFGEFVQPDLLGETERTHQIMRQARVSYRMTELGQVADVRVHAPTHPLAKSTLAQSAQLSSTMQPALPERAVQPGDSWEQAIVYRDAQGLAQMSQDSVNRYTFEKWRPCRDTLCAFITIKQEMKSAARMSWKDQQTQGASTGNGEGWLLFDYQRGEIVKSFWLLRGQGFVKAYQDAKISDDRKELASAQVLVELEVVTERIDDPDAMPPRTSERIVPDDASKPTP